MTLLTSAVLRTLRRALDTERYEYGAHSDLDDARHWLDDLERHWPDLGQMSAAAAPATLAAQQTVPEGRDVFPHLPVSGTPPND